MDEIETTGIIKIDLRKFLNTKYHIERLKEKRNSPEKSAYEEDCSARLRVIVSKYIIIIITG